MAVFNRLLRSPPPPPRSAALLSTLIRQFTTVHSDTTLITPPQLLQTQSPKVGATNVHWVFLGCPGVGKGTYATRLSKLVGVPHIATGDLVRLELSSSGPLSPKFGHTTTPFRLLATQSHTFCFSTIPHSQGQKRVPNNDSGKEVGDKVFHPVGQRITGKSKISILIKTLLGLGDSKDAIYGALDAWVAWEQNFPIASLKNVLLTLEKQQQWHRVVQVIKWMLSKGQGNTVGTFQQLIRALDMDHRAEEAHNFWMKKIGRDLQSVPWQACHLMLSVYFRNQMFDRVIKLFKSLEAYDRKPTDKLIVQKVADAYDLLGLVDDKERLLEKYEALMNKSTNECHPKSKRVKSRRKHTPPGRSRGLVNALEG